MRPQSRWLKRMCIMLGLLLSIWMGAGFCVSKAASGAQFFINQRLSGAAGELSLSFLPDLTGEYVLASFSDGTVEAEVVQAGETVASGALPLTVRKDCTCMAQAKEVSAFASQFTCGGRKPTTKSSRISMTRTR